MQKEYKRTVAGLMIAFIAHASVVNVFMLFYSHYMNIFGWEYKYIGMFLLFGFIVQIICDVVSGPVIRLLGFKFFNLVTPFVFILGVLCIVFAKNMFPSNVFTGFLLGQFFLSVAGGFYEIVVNSMIYNIPSDDNNKILSLVHGSYSFGLSAMVIITTIMIKFIGIDKWQIIVSVWLILPIIAFLVFTKAKMPENGLPSNRNNNIKTIKDKYFLLCVVTLFLVGSVEVMVTQWMSIYVEQTIKLSKFSRDLIAVGGFTFAIAMVRLIYSKFSKKIDIIYVLLVCIILTIINLLIMILSFNKYTILVVCFLSGISLSLLWPACIMNVGKKFPSSTAFIFGMLSLTGDLGSSFGPYLQGLLTDIGQKWQIVQDIAVRRNVAVDNIAMRIGLILGIVLLVVAFILSLIVFHMQRKHKEEFPHKESALVSDEY